MTPKNYHVKLTGISDIILHRDNIDWSERVKKWQKDPANKKMSVAGDDRSPAWTWIGYCYSTLPKSGLVSIDSDCIMSMLRDGGKKCPAPTGKGSMKSQTQSGILCNEIGWPIEINGKFIDYGKMLETLANESDFERHIQYAEDHGFELFVKRAKIGKNKHVRVRPRFYKWSAQGTITVSDDQLTKRMIETIFLFGGNYCGLGDWRPGNVSPGQFGRFIVEIDEA